MRSWATSTRGRRHAGRGDAGLIALLLAAPACAWPVGEVLPAVDESLTGIVALIGGAAAWLQRQAAWTRDRLADVQRAAAKLDGPVRELRAQHEKEVLELQLAHDAAARVAVDEQAKLAALEADLDATTPVQMLSRLLADRVASDDYSRHLGVLALVRRDFEAMTKLVQIDMKDVERFATIEDEEADDSIRVGRVVLYIDDLDRCEPDQVVAVLQAVHLLLAFPLFTVVVGVDMRWVERALRLHHKELLDSGEGGATPRDYLEKIFQIPFWLEPLDVDSSRTMLRGILGTAAPLPEVHRLESSEATAAAHAGSVAGDATPAGTGAPPSPRRPRSIAQRVAPVRDLQPQSLEVGEEELAAMDALAMLLGRSPRALKRFVNTYRLIKVRAPDTAAFLRDAEPIAPYRATLLLLALSTGLPHAGAELLDAILAGQGGTVATGLGSDAKVRAWLRDTAAHPWRRVPLEALRPHAEEVVRFTFHWHGAGAAST